VSFDVLINAIRNHKLNDCTHIVRACLEDQMLQNIRPVLKNDTPNQFINEGLGHSDIREVEDDILPLGQGMWSRKEIADEREPIR